MGRNQEALQQVLILLESQRGTAAANPESWAYWQKRAGNEIADQTHLVRIPLDRDCPKCGNKLMQKLGRKQLKLHLQEKLTIIPPSLAAHHLELSNDGDELIYTYDTKGERTGITALLNRRFKYLSTGETRKTLLCQALMSEPELLILDEPFTGFDPINANLIKDELLALKEKGTSIILSTHRMESVEELCTHIALINLSHKILEGSVSDIRKSYRSNTYEIVYEGNSISLANSLWGDFELTDTVTAGNEKRALIKLNNQTSPNELLRGLIENVTIHSFREVVPSMNDIFIQTVTSNNA